MIRDYIKMAREINDSAFTSKAIVRPQVRHQHLLDARSDVGIYYEGYHLPLCLKDYIGHEKVDFDLWRSNDKIKAFVTKNGY